MSRADKHVLLDSVSLSKNSVTNRCRIRNKTSWQYLTIPIRHEFYGRNITETLVPESRDWMRKHWTAILENYSRARSFSRYSNFFDRLYGQSVERLAEFNERAIRFVAKELGIRAEIVRASELKVRQSARKSELLLEIASSLGATTYLSGPTGRAYLDIGAFEKVGIKVEFFEFVEMPYEQAFPGFVPRLSATDALFNLGADAENLIAAR